MVTPVAIKVEFESVKGGLNFEIIMYFSLYLTWPFSRVIFGECDSFCVLTVITLKFPLLIILNLSTRFDGEINKA